MVGTSLQERLELLRHRHHQSHRLRSFQAEWITLNHLVKKIPEHSK